MRLRWLGLLPRFMPNEAVSDMKWIGNHDRIRVVRSISIVYRYVSLLYGI